MSGSEGIRISAINPTAENMVHSQSICYEQKFEKMSALRLSALKDYFLAAANLPTFKGMTRKEYKDAVYSLCSLFGFNADLKLPGPIIFGKYKFSGEIYFVAHYLSFFGFGTVTTMDKSAVLDFSETPALWYLNGINPYGNLNISYHNFKFGVALAESYFKINNDNLECLVKRLNKRIDTFTLTISNRSDTSSNGAELFLFTGICIKNGTGAGRICPFIPFDISNISGTFMLLANIYFENVTINSKYIFFTFYTNGEQSQVLKYPSERFWKILRYKPEQFSPLIRLSTQVEQCKFLFEDPPMDNAELNKKRKL